MESSRSKLRQEYTNEIQVIEANIKDIAKGDAPQELYDYSQNKLDKLAERFQYDEKLGAIRYKLYELQALLYYFQNRDDDALDFIQQAVKTKGSSYKRADQLIDQINKAPKMQRVDAVPEKELTKAEKRKRLIGLDGWLALFIVGLGIGALYNLYQLSTYPSAFSDLESARADSPEFVSELIPILWLEVVQFAALAATAIWLIVLFVQRKKLAKHVAIAFMAGVIVLGIIDYAWASSIFSSYSLNLDTELSEQAGAIGRAVIAALIWIPYFLVSKRVKATLTK